MAHKSRRTKPKVVEPMQAFTRILHSTKTLSAGIGKARQAANLEHIPEIVAAVLTNPIYAWQIVGNPFPKNLKEFKLHPRLDRTSPIREFIWCASVLAAFSAELQKFVPKREKFNEHFIRGEYDNAMQSLDSIEEDHGMSLWLLSNKIQLLQLTKGLAAQKDFFESIIDGDGISVFAAWLSYFFSRRSEENVSLTALETETQDLTGAHWLRDYAILHIVPYNVSGIADPSQPIFVEQSQPIIDRFQTFVTMAILQLTKADGFEQPHIISAIRQIASVNDPRISQIIHLLDGSVDPSWGATLAVFDAYTEGDYATVLKSDKAPFELKARARLLQSDKPEKSGRQSLSVEIESAMADLLTASDDYHKSTLQLRKLAITCSGTWADTQIAAFLERSHDHVTVEQYSDLDQFVALNGCFANPWSSDVIAGISGAGHIHSLLREAFPGSTALALRDAIAGPAPAALPAISKLRLPHHRRAMYLGHAALKNGSYSMAAAHYKSAGDRPGQYVAIIADSYLFKALYKMGLLEEALKLVIHHCLQNQSAYRYYPLEDIALAAIDNKVTRQSADLVIALHILSKQVHPKWERELSDVYENFLTAAGVSRPRNLSEKLDRVAREKIIYILRYVCVSRILDDTTLFENVEEIEEERIAICRSLAAIDSDNSEIYSEEIRTIVRNTQIADLLNKVEASKIYVDEEGIRTGIEDMMRDSFARYQILLQSPEMNYQAEKISKRMGELLRERNPDLAKLQLPSSEREGLFNTILETFVSQFAMDPAYGLDTHLSTTIRHGAFEGHVRSPLAAEELLCPYDERSKGSVFPSGWDARLNDAPSEVRNSVLKQMIKFTDRVVQAINFFLQDVLRVRAEHENPKGAFNFLMTREERLALMEDITPDISYEAFISSMFSLCWQKTDTSMDVVRKELRLSLQEPINLAFSSLLGFLDALPSNPQLPALRDAIVRSRTAFQASIEAISGWFHRPIDLRRNPFEIDLAVGVALKQIENCYIKINASLGPSISGQFEGAFLDGLVEILFILLQNIIRHSRIEGAPTGVKIRVTHDGAEILIEVENDLAAEVDLRQLRETAVAASQRYEEDAVLQVARTEGGSGLSKIRRILQFDLKRAHRIQLEVRDSYTFRAAVWFSDRGVLRC